MIALYILGGFAIGFILKSVFSSNKQQNKDKQQIYICCFLLNFRKKPNEKTEKNTPQQACDKQINYVLLSKVSHISAFECLHLL